MACCPSNPCLPKHPLTSQDTKDFVWHPPTAAEATSTPARPSSFTEVNVQTKLRDGYYIEAFQFRSTPLEGEGPVGPELIGSGLGPKNEDGTYELSEVCLYRNPYNEMKNQIPPIKNEWQRTLIKKYPFAVSITHGNLRQKSGLNDVFVCHTYGPSMDDLDMQGGILSWLQNPGHKEDKGEWVSREIGRSPATHRIKTGHFTQREHLEVLSLPIMTKSSDRETPAPVLIYKPEEWDEDGTPTKWKETKAFPSTFRLIHEVQVIAGTNGGLDKAIVAGREGVNQMWYDEKAKTWMYANIGTGIPQSRKPFKNPYWGSGACATSRVGTDSVGYIASCEAFHGNLVSVYVKPPGTRPDQIVASENWRRFVIDDFGPLKPEEFTGTVHHVACADLDGTGVDSIIVSCMGYPEGNADNMGTYVYKPVDLTRGLFSRSKITDSSAGRSAIADYRCSGTMDVATISYSVPGYLVTKNPAVRVMLNNTKNIRRSIKAQGLGDEVVLRVSRANEAKFSEEMPFWDIGGKLLSIVVLPPHKEYLLGKAFEYHGLQYAADGVKVINGVLTWQAKSGGTARRGIAVDRYKAATLIPDTDTGIVKAGPTGAIFIRLASSIATAMPGLNVEEMDDVATVNTLPFGTDSPTRDMTFPWVACKDRPWGAGSFDWPFYNAVGFHVVYDDDSLTNICHIQAWTLGVGRTAGFHNHSDKSFCEIHACISNGTGRGGMYWAKNEAADKWFDKDEKNRLETNLETLKNYTEMVVVNDMEEHGPLWHEKESNGKTLPRIRDNATVDYPFHAWLAGPAQEKEAFDVWLAFEFPPSEFQSGVSKYNGCASCA